MTLKNGQEKIRRKSQQWSQGNSFALEYTEGKKRSLPGRFLFSIFTGSLERFRPFFLQVFTASNSQRLFGSCIGCLRTLQKRTRIVQYIVFKPCNHYTPLCVLEFVCFFLRYCRTSCIAWHRLEQVCCVHSLTALLTLQFLAPRNRPVVFVMQIILCIGISLYGHFFSTFHQVRSRICRVHLNSRMSCGSSCASASRILTGGSLLELTSSTIFLLSGASGWLCVMRVILCMGKLNLDAGISSRPLPQCNLCIVLHLETGWFCLSCKSCWASAETCGDTFFSTFHRVQSLISPTLGDRLICLWCE